MLEHEIEDGVLFLSPNGKLTKEDFEAVVEVVDAHIAEFGALRGMIISATAFPGWANFSAMTATLKFVKGHQDDIASIAIVTDDSVASHFRNIAKHFGNAEIRNFPRSEADAATDWVCSH